MINKIKTYIERRRQYSYNELWDLVHSERKAKDSNIHKLRALETKLDVMNKRMLHLEKQQAKREKKRGSD